MQIGPWELGYPHLLAVGLCFTLLLGAGVGASTSATTYGPFNSAWDGASGLQTVATETHTETVVAFSTTEYRDVAADEAVAVVVSPQTAYTDAEAARVASFVRNGGTLIVAEDFRPHSNALLDRIGASARVNATPLRDERHNYRAGSLPIATRTASDPRLTDVEQLTLNHPGTVTPNGSSVLVNSSNFSYRDVDSDGELDDEETLRSYPVVTAESVGSGTVIVVSDPSVFINAMLDRPDNRAFAEALLGPHGTVLLDYSHAEQQPPLQVALSALRDSAVLQFLVGVSVLGTIVVVSRRRGLSP